MYLVRSHGYDKRKFPTSVKHRRMTQKPTALVVGATGALGKALTRDLLQTDLFRRVITIGRRPVEFPEGSGVPTENLISRISMPIARLSVVWSKSIDAQLLVVCHRIFLPQNAAENSYVFGTLGIARKAAGSPENFKRIDQGYIVKTAKIAAEENPGQGENALSPVHYIYCSSIGANARSHFLYLKSKGETENALAESCNLSRVTTVRPTGLDVEEERPRGTYWYETLVFDYINRPLNWLGFKMSAPVAVLARGMRRAALGEIPEKMRVIKKTKGNGTVFNIIEYKEFIELGLQP
ncbi:hypothetical protein BC938DRAFT_477584 [Jimgerdemannia flammicorona]|uniref:NAD(P)-binding domain-containing protein n=1 Tax=Jimgerdemannia flammicorona TaxID=994334 RepID=A0A433QP61_9FUNG|nr:hypothetical protein BC938DRAFT_477584 [Jimgerdemannia flammicorona]